jgi:hypothetical protein
MITAAYGVLMQNITVQHLRDVTVCRAAVAFSLGIGPRGRGAAGGVRRFQFRKHVLTADEVVQSQATVDTTSKRSLAPIREVPLSRYVSNDSKQLTRTVMQIKQHTYMDANIEKNHAIRLPAAL